MKRLAVSLVAILLSSVAGMAQNSYIVKTKGVKKPSVQKVRTDRNLQTKVEEEEEEGPIDFIGANFKYRSLCDWQEGMRFMVMPEKYDLVVNTFVSDSTHKEVSSGKLRYKIMVFKGVSETEDGKWNINFLCEDDGIPYHFQVPSGSFDDYCYKKMGVATLAYLGDVDIARKLLMGQKLRTVTNLYRVDTEYDGEGYQEVSVKKGQIVKVVAIGVGERSFPVKIIVEDAAGNQFFQNVAMSKINSGMRDEEFGMEKAKFTFYGSFELVNEEEEVLDDSYELSGNSAIKTDDKSKTGVKSPTSKKSADNTRSLGTPIED